MKKLVVLLLCIIVAVILFSCENIGKFALVEPQENISNPDAAGELTIGSPGADGDLITTDQLAPPTDWEKQLQTKGKVVAEVAAPYTEGWSLVGYSVLSSLLAINRLIVANKRGRAIVAIDKNPSSIAAREQVQDVALRKEIDKVVAS